MTQEILQDSGETEYYTDPIITAAAREVMGKIDLDPASTPEANVFVQADTILTKADNTLEVEWRGNVWMNHPFSRINNPLFINKILEDYKSGHIEQACFITYASTSEKWFKKLYAYPICFLVPRTNYFLPSGKKKHGVQKGSAVTYLGSNANQFYDVFSELGEVMARYQKMAV